MDGNADRTPLHLHGSNANPHAEKDDAVQPATAVDSRSEGNEKAKPESEGRSQ